MPVNCCVCRRELADYDKSSLFFIWRICAIFAWKTSDSKYSLGIPKSQQDGPHFELKYLSNDGINRDRFIVKNFLKYTVSQN